MDILPLPDGLEEQLPVSIRAVQTVDAGRVRAYAESTLTGTDLSALRLWCEGLDHGEIAAELGLASPLAAQKVVRAVIRRLRRFFTGEE